MTIVLGLLLAYVAVSSGQPLVMAQDAAASAELTGRWEGETSQGKPMTVEIERNIVQRAYVAYKLLEPCKDAELDKYENFDHHRRVWKLRQKYDPPLLRQYEEQARITDGQFSTEMGGMPSAVFKGRFDADKKLHGEVVITGKAYPRSGGEPCDYRIELTFQAENLILARAAKMAKLQEDLRTGAIKLVDSVRIGAPSRTAADKPRNCEFSFAAAANQARVASGQKEIAVEVTLTPQVSRFVQTLQVQLTGGVKAALETQECREFVLVEGQPVLWRSTTAVRRGDGKLFLPGRYTVTVVANGTPDRQLSFDVK